MKRFEEALAILAERGLHPPLVHMSNSAAVSARPDTWKTMVRPGILLYGYSLPTMRAGETTNESSLPLRPVLVLEDARSHGKDMWPREKPSATWEPM